MEHEVFTSLAKTLQEIGNRPKRPSSTYFRARLVEVLTKEGWKRRRWPYALSWRADVYEKDTQRIVIDRYTGREIDHETDFSAEVFTKKVYLYPTCIIHERQWVALAGHHTKKGLRLWLAEGAQFGPL